MKRSVVLSSMFLLLGFMFGVQNLHAMGSRSNGKKTGKRQSQSSKQNEDKYRPTSSPHSSGGSHSTQSSGSSASGVSSPALASGRLKVGGIFQYQLDGSIRDHRVDVVVLDLFDTSASKISSLKSQGKVVICYFSAGTLENWRPDRGKVSSSAIGNNVDGWSGERWMDIRHSSVVNLSKSRIDLARSKGCQGVDPDNVDVYSHSSGFPITKTHVKTYLRTLASYAQSKGLSLGLKNAAEIASEMSAYTDFAVVEQCYQYNECGSFSSFISRGKPVYIIEYRAYSSSLCQNAKSRKMSLIFARENLSGDIGYCR